MDIYCRVLKSKDSLQYRTVRLESLKRHPDSFGSTYETQCKLSKLYFEGLIENESDESIMIGAFSNEKLVGLCGLTPAKNFDSLEVVQMYVSPATRGKAVGHQLLSKAESILRIRSESNLELRVYSNNYAAIKLYEFFGFKQIAKNENEIVMTLVPQSDATRQRKAMEQHLKNLIKSVPELIETAKICQSVGLPNFYIAGGSITQLIWNYLLERPPLDSVKDFDIVYFDKNENQPEKWFENVIQTQLKHTIKIDIKNQANVHKWYPKRFGQVISAYTRVEQGIDSWLSAFAIGFTLDIDGNISIYSPYGLEDAFDMNVKPNKIAMMEPSYIKMTNSFKERWPSISVEPWNNKS